MLKIYSDSSKYLRTRSVEVTLPLSKEDRKLLLNMLEHLKQSQDPDFAKKHKLREGVGLAAPQVGVNKRMIAVYYHKGEEIVQYGLVNPKIIASSLRQCALQNGEGCLSVDNPHEGLVYRSHKITVKAYDILQDKEITIIAFDYDAIVIQHEVDHLNGVLFYDHIDAKNPFEKKENAVII